MGIPWTYLSSPPSAAASLNIRDASAADAPRTAAKPDMTTANTNTLQIRLMENRASENA